MEVITMDSKVYKDLVGKIQRIADFVAKAQVMPKEENEVWLDSQEVCLLLGFSKRTLQYYRSSGRLAYSQIGSKIYYKSSDIERIITDSETRNQSPKQTTPYEKN